MVRAGSGVMMRETRPVARRLSRRDFRQITATSSPESESESESESEMAMEAEMVFSSCGCFSLL